MEKITELTKPLIVGQNYRVPCVKSSAVNWTDRTIPVLGDFHWDTEIIGFPDEHIHIDFRFISRAEFRRLYHLSGISPFAQVISKEFVEFETWEIRRCNRPMPKFPEQTPELHIT
ncbi:hypothetical protein NIES2119_19505 [[Phormidium ambiguum] IAM M-71]|uniref:Uncharacterized protein n=1 Tax=[Phormidium ambiguum] IAM M-71 TaxID=454136 RepID=A0A1U7IF79_9CYAN|nr:hypothetical protein [Phormidium ambiguum]OKH35688.1 hypothetical protein NIES2119_19505 [Phormidium ambiguum IAM M-71]